MAWEKVVLWVGVLGALAVLAVLLWPVARHRFIYPGGRLSPAMADPALHGLSRAEQVELEADDGVRIHGWWTPADASTEASPTDAARGAVIYFHGNAETIATRAWLADRLARLGLHVLLFDYRGYGLSEGRAGEEGLARDARAAWRHVVEQRGVPPDRVVLMGHSLGSAVAARLALELAGVSRRGTPASPPPGDVEPRGSSRPAGDAAESSTPGRPAALVVGSPFPDMPTVFAHHAPWLPERALRWRTDRLAAGSRLADVDVPTLVAIGSQDELIPPALSRRAAEGLDHATLVTVAADHATVMGHPEIWDRLRRFLQGVLDD